MSASQPINFRELQRQVLPYLPAILRRVLPDGRVEGSEYVARNPRRIDRHPGSFKISLVTGKWADFAVGASGGDATSLVAYVLGISQTDAAGWLMRLIGRVV